MTIVPEYLHKLVRTDPVFLGKSQRMIVIHDPEKRALPAGPKLNPYAQWIILDKIGQSIAKPTVPQLLLRGSP